MIKLAWAAAGKVEPSMLFSMPSLADCKLQELCQYAV